MLRGIRFIYSLSDQEIRATSEWARKRTDRGGYKDRTPEVNTSTSLFDRHLMGVRSELAVAAVLGGKMNTDVFFKGDGRGAGDGDKGDVTIGGTGVCVKFRTEAGMDFALHDTNWMNFRDALGILVWPFQEQSPDGHHSAFELVGWCTRKQFKNEHEILRFGRFKRAGIRWKNMRPMPSLIALLSTNERWVSNWKKRN